MKPDDLSSLVDRHVHPLIQAKLSPGAVVGIHRNGETHFWPYGSTHLDQASLPDAHTVYETGSVGKLFTCLMLAEAVRHGEVTLETTIEKLLPAGVVAPRFEGHPIRLWHLASHTSGLPREPDNMEPVLEGDPNRDYTEAKLWSCLGSLKLNRAPGVYEYSNLGAGLLAVLLEKRSGRNYQQLLQERITKPLGCDDTTLTLSASQRSRLAQPTSGELINSNWGTDDALHGAGAIRATAADTIKFAVSQFDLPDHPIADSIQLTHQPMHQTTDGERIALGWHVYPDDEIYWHNGSTGGYHCFVAFHKTQRWAIALMANTSSYHITLAGERLTQCLANRHVAPIEIKQAIDILPEQLRPLPGAYQSSDGIVIHIRQVNDKLIAQIEGQIALRVYPLSAKHFFYRDVDAELEFEFNDKGNAKSVTIVEPEGIVQCIRK